jgi:hypothetical protein
LEAWVGDDEQHTRDDVNLLLEDLNRVAGVSSIYLAEDW